MSCDISYIRTGYPENTQDTLARAHWGLHDKLLASGYLKADLSVKPEASAFVQQMVSEMNEVYRPYIGVGYDPLKLYEGKVHVDVRPIAEFVLRHGGLTPAVIDNEMFPSDLYYGEASPLGSAQDNSNATVNAMSGFFGDTISTLKQKLSIYKKILRDNPGQAVYARRVKDIEEVLANEDELKAISGFISLSAKQLEAAKAKFDSIKLRYTDVTKLTADEIQDFSTQLVEIQNFLNFYSSLKEIKGIMDKNGISFQFRIQSRIGLLLETKYGLDVPLAIKAALEGFNVTDAKSMSALTTALYNEGDFELAKEIQKRINSTFSEDWNTPDQELLMGIDAINDLIGEFDNYYTDITTEWLYPNVDALNQGLEGKAKAYEETAAKLREQADAADGSVKQKLLKKADVQDAQAADKRNQILSKKEFKSQIKLARKDLSFFTKWMGAPISVEDPLTASIATTLKTAMYTAKGEVDTDLYDLMDAYQQVHGGKAPEGVHDPYLRKATLVRKDDEGNLVYEERTAMHEEFYHDKYWQNYTEEQDRIEKAKEDIREKFRLEIMRAVGRESLTKDEEDTISQRVDKWAQEQMREWLKENSEIRPDWKALLEQKRKALTPENFRIWLNRNVRQQEDVQWISEYGHSSLKNFLEEQGVVLPDEYAKLIQDDIRPGYFLIMTREFIQPKREKYANLSYAKLIAEDPYFKKLYNLYRKSNESYPPNRRLNYGIIQQSSRTKSLQENWLRGTPSEMVKNAKERIYKSWEIEANDPAYERDVDVPGGGTVKEKFSKEVQHLDGTPVRNIPIRYTALLEDDSDVDTNLLTTIGAFAYSSNIYKELSKVDANVQIVKTLIKGNQDINVKGREVAQVGLDDNPLAAWIENGVKRYAKQEKDFKVNELLDEFLNDIVYGEEEYVSNAKLLGMDVSLNKLGRNLGFITSLYTMAFNFQAGIGNMVLGNVATFTEGVGGRFWTVNDNLAAHKDYAKAFWSGEFLKDFMHNDNWAKKGMITQMLIKYDAVQGEFMTPEGKVVTGNVAAKLLSTDTLFWTQNATEHEIQSIGMISAMRGFKLSNGKSLWDAQGVDKTGKLVILDEYKDIVTPEVEQAFMRRLHGINKQHHGNYNKFDKSSLQRRWYGKLALMFRKYLYTSFKARLGGKQLDYELGDTTEGYHRVSFNTVKDFSQKFIKDWKQFGFNTAIASTMPLTDDQIYARNKTLMEAAWFVMAMGIVALANAWDPDEEDKIAYWVNNEAKLQAKRLENDLIQFVMPFGLSSLMKVITSPAVALTVVDKISDFLQLLLSPQAFDTYQRDTGFAKKGDSKLWVRFLKLMPVFKQFITLMNPADQAKYYDLLKYGGNSQGK